jgi:MFS family permease
LKKSLADLFLPYLDMLITRLRPSYYMAGGMALWSIISALTAVTHDYKGMILTRFFLGIAEAPFYPGALYLVSMFYTKDEIATRMSILFTANICGTVFAGLLAIGVFEMSGIAGISGWRWLFILFGIVSFVFAVASAWVLPDEPYNTRWLTEDERRLAVSRMEADTTELKANTSTWRGLLDALKDARLWVLIFMQHLHLGSYPVPLSHQSGTWLTTSLIVSCFWIQKLLPVHRRDSRFQSQHHSCPDVPTLSDCWRVLHHLGLELR